MIKDFLVKTGLANTAVLLIQIGMVVFKDGYTFQDAQGILVPYILIMLGIYFITAVKVEVKVEEEKEEKNDSD
jgi:hypothetical protein